MKYCRECDKTISKSNFNKNSITKDGLHSWCKDCVKASHERLKSRIKKIVLEKVCSACKVNKPIDEFNKFSLSADGHKSQCRNCINIKQRKYSKSDRGKKARKIYRQTETYIEYNTQYTKEYAERRKTINLNYRIRKANLEGSHDPQEVLAMQIMELGSLCPCCLETSLLDSRSLDHIVPIQEGQISSNDLSNVMYICSSCNSSKRDRKKLCLFYPSWVSVESIAWNIG